MLRDELLAHVLGKVSELTGHAPVEKGGWHNCRCVAHEDQNPSLGIRAGDKAIIFKCQAGCAPKDIAARLGMEMRDLFYRDDAAEEARRRDRADQPRGRRPRGITVDELAREKGMPADHLRACGCEDLPVEKGGGVRIAYRLQDGTEAPRHRLRFALKAKDGSRWSGKREDGPIVAYGLWRVREAQEKGYLVLVEGETDSLALWLHGEPALGIPGASATSALDPQVLFGVKTIFVVQEPDKAGSQFPRQVWTRVREYWQGQIRVVRLQGAKDPCQLHQVHRDHFPAQWRLAMEQAKPFDPGPERYWAIPEHGSADDGDHLPQDVARYLLDTDFPPIASARHTLAYHRDTWYRYDGRSWVEYPLGELRAAVTRFTLDSGAGKPNGHFVSDVLLNLSAHVTIPGTTPSPVWLATGASATRAIPLENGILDLDALTGQTGQTLRPHTSDLWSFNALPYPYRPGADCPRWQSFLDEVLPRTPGEAQGMQDLLAEWCGYCLLPTQQYQRILVMIGEGANGKSVVMNVLRRLVGEPNCSDVSLESLALPHASAGLVGKLVNFCDEWGAIGADAESIVKAISGSGWVTVNPKNKAPFTSKIAARFTVASNEPPRINDRSDAMWRRLLIVPFKTVIEQDRRRPLEPFVEELCEELPGILNWALLGLIRLCNRGRFIDSQATADAKNEYRLDSNPARIWLEENVERSDRADEELAITSIYRQYKARVEAEGNKPLAITKFGVEARRHSSRLGVQQPPHPPRIRVHDKDGNPAGRSKALVGLRVRSDWD